MNDQKQPAVAGPVEPTVRPNTLAAFLAACIGGRGDLDAWLECNNEAEVRAHVLALLKAEQLAERERIAKVCEAAWEIDGTKIAAEFAALVRGA